MAGMPKHDVCRWPNSPFKLSFNFHIDNNCLHLSFFLQLQQRTPPLRTLLTRHCHFYTLLLVWSCLVIPHAMFGLNRLTRLAIDLVAISTIIAGVKKSTGFA